MTMICTWWCPHHKMPIFSVRANPAWVNRDMCTCPGCGTCLDFEIDLGRHSPHPDRVYDGGSTGYPRGPL